MPTPFRKEQLSQAMRERYGMDRRPTAGAALSVLLALAFIATLGWVTWSTTRGGVQADLRSWRAYPDHVDVVVAVSTASPGAVTCVIRAQDRTRADVGYANVTLPSALEPTTVTYRLHTIVPAYVVEVLGCAVGQAPRVTGPQFPPGVVPPAQPWAEAGSSPG
jgi:Domain of unknown function (DUF4307)